MKNIDLGQVIAERELTLLQDDGLPVPVLVRLGAPTSDPRQGGDWYCPYQVVGLGEGKVRAARGVDSVQALQLALTMVAAELDLFQRLAPGRLAWLEGSDLGLRK